MKNCLVGVVLFCLGSVMNSGFSQECSKESICFNPKDYAPVPNYFIIAHRGWSGKYPENSLLAYAGTREADADACEIDIHMTSDGEMVMMHDGDTFRTTGHHGKIAKMTFEEIRKLDIGSIKGKEFTGTKIPTFDESMTLLKNNQCPTLIEIKSSRPFPFPEVAKKVIDKIKDYGYLDKVIMNSFSVSEVATIRKIEPNICVAFNYDGKKSYASVSELVDDVTLQLKKADTNIILLHEHNLTPESMKLFHERGIHILAWFGIKPKRMKELVDMKVDGIITDYPDVLRKIVNKTKSE